MKKKISDEKEEEQGDGKGIAESFLGSMPVLGDLFKELGKTEVFKERFKEVDEKIKENLKKGEKREWGFEANLSVRPIMSEVEKETSELSVHEDYFYGRKGRKLVLAVKVPQGKVSWRTEGKNLFVKSDNFEKKVRLPDYFRVIENKQHKEGILVLELTK